MKKIIILLTILLSLIAVTAEAYEFDIQPIRNEIETGEVAQFLVVINSNASTIKELKMYSSDVEWDVSTEIIKVYPTSETNYKLIITPSKYVEPGKIYGIRLNFKDISTDEIIYSDIAEVSVKSKEKAVSAYRPSIKMTIDMPSTVDPSQPVDVKVKLENQNLLNIGGAKLIVSSEVAGFDAEQEFELESLGKKIIEMNYNLDPLQNPGDYRLNFEIFYEGETVESNVNTITISEAKPAFNKEETQSGILFKKVTTKKLTSLSNVEDTQTIKIPTSFIQGWFTSVNLDSYKIEEDGANYIVVDVTLKPGESKDLIVSVNYRIILYLILLALIILTVHYRYKSPLTIKKNISDVNAKEGGISDLKVTLELANNGKKNVKKVTITDYIPNIARIEKEFSEGTLRPSRVFRHKTKGIVLKWDIDELSPGEDRIMTYTVKSNLSIVGEFKVPRAKANFKKKGREITAYSNATGVSS